MTMTSEIPKQEEGSLNTQDSAILDENVKPAEAPETPESILTEPDNSDDDASLEDIVRTQVKRRREAGAIARKRFDDKNEGKPSGRRPASKFSRSESEDRATGYAKPEEIPFSPSEEMFTLHAKMTALKKQVDAKRMKVAERKKLDAKTYEALRKLDSLIRQVYNLADQYRDAETIAREEHKKQVALDYELKQEAREAKHDNKARSEILPRLREKYMQNLDSPRSSVESLQKIKDETRQTTEKRKKILRSERRQRRLSWLNLKQTPESQENKKTLIPTQLLHELENDLSSGRIEPEEFTRRKSIVNRLAEAKDPRSELDTILTEENSPLSLEEYLQLKTALSKAV